MKVSIVKTDGNNPFHRYCRNKGLVPLSECRFDEQLKKTVHVRESKLTLYTEEHPAGTRFRVWRGVELVGKFSKTEFSTNRGAGDPIDPGVHGSQTRLEKGGKYLG
jgi:hypothetical protein